VRMAQEAIASGRNAQCVRACSAKGNSLACAGSLSAAEEPTCKSKRDGLRECRIDGSDAGGFKVDNLPAGEYDMEVWHERLGPRRQLITVSGESLISLNVVYAPDQVR